MDKKMPSESEAFITRHSVSGKGSEYEGLSPEGVEKARERAKELAALIEQAEKGSVVFFGGNTYESRTSSTLQAYFDELKEILSQNPDILMFDQGQVQEEAREGYLKAAKSLQDQADTSPDSKVVIELPLKLKDFNKKEWFYGPDGNMIPEWDALLSKHGKDYGSAIKEWFSRVENGDKALLDPTEIAESYLKGIARLENFVKKFSGDRKVKIVVVGHSFLIDAFLTYLSNNGKVTPEAFDKLEGVIDTTELSILEPDSEGNLHLEYRGNEYVFKKDSSKGLLKENN